MPDSQSADIYKRKKKKVKKGHKIGIWSKHDGDDSFVFAVEHHRTFLHLFSDIKVPT